MQERANGCAGPKKLRVLIVDDSNVVRGALSGLVTPLKNVDLVGTARTGREALEMMRSLKPDVATLDIRMPDLNGIEVLEAVRREKLGVSVIVLTGLNDLEYRRRCMDLGAEYFFHKATEFERVIEVLDERASRRLEAACATTEAA